MSETLAQTSATALRQANRRHDVVAVQVTDPRELELPNVGWVVLQDAETGQIVEINTGDTRRREAETQRRKLEVERCERLLAEVIGKAELHCMPCR